MRKISDQNSAFCVAVLFYISVVLIKTLKIEQAALLIEKHKVKNMYTCSFLLY